MKGSDYSLVLHELKSLSADINRMIEDGSFYSLAFTKRYSLIHRIKRLYTKLRGPVSDVRLRHILAGAAVLVLGLSCRTVSSQSQDDIESRKSVSAAEISFSDPVDEPFGVRLGDVYWTGPAFADIDDDGDLDLFAGGYDGNMWYFLNTGSAKAPQFAGPIQNPFGLFTTTYYAFLSFADIDDDGDLDLFMGEYDGGIQFFQNVGSAIAPSFAAPIQNPFHIKPYPVYYAVPAMVDIDGDGDLDLFVGEYMGNIQYFENTGTSDDPSFADPMQNPFGIVPADYYSFPSFTDIDGDGDLDLFVGEYYGSILYFENVGTAREPIFTEPIQNPFDITPRLDYWVGPVFADIDDDGDMDLFVVGDYGSFQYFENTTRGQ
jgi:hypothetical protein